MNIADLYRSDGYAALTRLAQQVGANPKYLYQCATGRRLPSPALAWKLVGAEPRLVFDEIYRDARPEVPIDGARVGRPDAPAVPCVRSEVA